jgi:hypothetical protein
MYKANTIPIVIFLGWEDESLGLDEESLKEVNAGWNGR